LPRGADHAPVGAVAREPDVEPLDLGGEVPVRFTRRLAAEHADGDLHPREFRAFEFDRVDARQQVDRGVRDQPGMQQVADVGGVAARRIAVVVGDEVAQPRGVPRLGRGLGLVQQRADLLLRRARGTAAGER
jgi:hypothetical protein